MSKERIDRVDIFAEDIQVRRVWTCTSSRPPGSGRGPVVAFSRRAMTKARRHIRNTRPAYCFELVLTYPGRSPTDHLEVRSHLSRFLRSVRPPGVNACWVQEFTETGRPHFHVLFSRPLELGKCLEKWAAIIGEFPHPQLVHAQPFVDVTRVAGYLLNKNDVHSHVVPEGYKNMTSFWGSVGCPQKPEPIKTVMGTDADTAALLDLVRASQRNAGRYMPRDGGVGTTTYFGASRDVLNCLEECEGR
jgi:hypothetical protein